MARSILMIAILFVSLHCMAEEDNRSYLAASDSLFPETRNWLDISRAPKLSAAQFSAAKEPIERAYRASFPDSKFLEGKDCSFIKRTLESPEPTNFYQVDVDHDGILDIVYSGSAHCAEGSATVIWYGSVNDFFVRQPTVWPLLMLRLSPDGQDVTSVAQGCCGAPTDKYFLGKISRFRQGGGVQMVTETELPAKAISPSFSFVTKHEVKLRLSPKVLNEYEPGRSEFLGRAVFGNMVRTYRAGAKGSVVGETYDHGRHWFYVVMAGESDSLAVHDPYVGVRAGWLSASKALVIKQ